MMFDFHNQFLFPTHAVAPPGPLPRGAKRATITSADGDELHGVHIAPAKGRSRERTLILGFGGNAWNADDVASFLHHHFPAADVVAFHYRGYWPSTGSPSVEALLEDAPLVYDFAVERVPADRTIAVGMSIGTGVAASLAGERPLDGLILVTPFDSIKAVASDHYPFLPMGALFREDMDSAAALADSRVPTAIIAGQDDSIIPPRRTQALRRSVGNLVFDRTIPGAGHNDIYQRLEFRDAMDDALEAVTNPGR